MARITRRKITSVIEIGLYEDLMEVAVRLALLEYISTNMYAYVQFLRSLTFLLS